MDDLSQKSQLISYCYTIRYIDPYVRKERVCTVRGDNEEHAKERFFELYRGLTTVDKNLPKIIKT